ncbi:OmpA family protein [Sulfuriroseicoccus oceanibius]|uniref:OmpA family protein n=1 Tax=Sulfuriroseicoccus oceanibius TaxID=2707525 RepID=A0A6B3L8C3_9BACT|nr:phosphate ABC transporter substrate-binding/OmpA family protein [Sulfuriroseicoccus oceanibius]QQL43760.1 OmpA family protein [Sulfuriroseicoccus oceanibius]
MSSKKFRCDDPTESCPLSVSKEIVDPTPDWKCPCNNPHCETFREPIKVTETRGFKSAIKGIFALLVVALIALGAYRFITADRCEGKLNSIHESLEQLSSEVGSLETAIAASQSTQGNQAAIAELQQGVGALASAANGALAAKDDEKVAALQAQASEFEKQLQHLQQKASQPLQTDELRTQAGQLVQSLQQLEETTQTTQQESACDTHGVDYDNLTESVRAEMARASKLARGNDDTQGRDSDKQQLMVIGESLTGIQQSLNAYVPLPPVLFDASEATMRIVTVDTLGVRLLQPLILAQLTDVEIQTDGSSSYVRSGEEKILITTTSVDQAFTLLAEGKADLLIVNRPPSEAELAQLGPDFKESRSVAEVIALDAMTLLAHPETELETYHINDNANLITANGELNELVKSLAQRWGLQPITVDGSTTETAVLLDKSVIGLGAYHAESRNIRAKRLAVQATKDTRPLKPSPFTIATEDYPFTYRVVAWTPQSPSQNALDFVQFATSDKGQSTVADCGFVDLRLRPMQGSVDPRILAALGEALGEDIKSALRISTNLRFATGKSDLDLKAQADLERLPKFVAANYPKHQLVILGFTDSTGGADINIPLSKERAQTVVDELLKSNVDTKAAGLGSEFPIDTNETEAGKARNRRAEVWVVKP